MKQMLKEWCDGEKEKMKEMTKEEKVDYIITYYKGWFIGAFVLLAILIWIPYHFIFDKTEVSFRCAVVNGVLKDSDMDLSDDLYEYFGFESSKEYAYFDTGYQISYGDITSDAADTSFYEKFFLNIRTGSLDVAIIPQSFMEYCNDVDRVFYDVNEVLSAEQISEYESYYVRGKDAEGVEYICGIDISHFSFFDNEEFSFVQKNIGEPIILVFPQNAQHKELCQQFLDFLEEYEK